MKANQQDRVWKHLLILVVALSAVTSGWSREPSTTSSSELAKRFATEKVFFQQFEVARELVELRDQSVLETLAPLLSVQDRHVRANTAYVFEALGDSRGFETLRDILDDTSCRPIGQGIPGGIQKNQPCIGAQVRSDRYYAVHMFGELRDKKAVSILVPLLRDEAINYKVAWALGVIGDKTAIAPLISATYDDNPDVRATAVHALAHLDAKESLPRMRELLSDDEKCHLDRLVPVSQAAREAITELDSTH